MVVIKNKCYHVVFVFKTCRKIRLTTEVWTNKCTNEETYKLKGKQGKETIKLGFSSRHEKSRHRRHNRHVTMSRHEKS